MPVSKIRLFTTIWFLIVFVSIAAVPASSQNGPIMCACPKPIPHKPLGNAANCEEACYGRRSNGGTPSGDNGAAARKAEEDRIAAEDARKAAEAEQARRDEESRLKKIADQKAFEAARDEAAKTIKGSRGTYVEANSPNGTGLRNDNGGSLQLKGSRPESTIRDGRPKTVERDFSGPHAAWKQLFCSASILNSAIGSLNIDDSGGGKPDYSGFKNLALEAGNALNGEIRGVPCASAPNFPTFTGKYADEAKLAAAGKRLIDKVVVLSDKLEKAQASKHAAKAEMTRPTQTPTSPPVADVIAEQRRINAFRAEEARRIAKAQADFDEGVRSETAAKAKLGKIQADVAKAIEQPERFGVTFDEDAPEPASPPAKTPSRKN